MVTSLLYLKIVRPFTNSMESDEMSRKKNLSILTFSFCHDLFHHFCFAKLSQPLLSVFPDFTLLRPLERDETHPPDSGSIPTKSVIGVGQNAVTSWCMGLSRSILKQLSI